MFENQLNVIVKVDGERTSNTCKTSNISGKFIK